VAIHDIATEAPSWSGTPRLATNQYIQDAITLGDPGDTYNLEIGDHRGQVFVLAANDELVLETGARLAGAEDVGTSGWSDEGSNVWSKTVQNGDVQMQASNSIRSGYDSASLEVMIVDGEMRGWVTTQGAVNEWFCYASGSTVYLYSTSDPDSAYSTIEIARGEDGYGIFANGAGITIRGESQGERAEVYGYASEPGGGFQQGGIYLGGTSGSHSTIRDIDLYACAGVGFGAGSYVDAYNLSCRGHGQLGTSYMGPDNFGEEVFFHEGCYFYNCGGGGWNTSWEGGNSKFAWVNGVHLKGTLWDQGPHPDSDGLAPCWFDANIDGYTIDSSVFRDLGHWGSKGLFIEIAYTGKVRNNILLELAWDSGDDWQANCVYMDGSGADHDYWDPVNEDAEDSSFYEYVNSDIEIYGNLAYKCAGGFGGSMNRGSDWNDVWDGSDGQRYGYWISNGWNIHDNTTYFDGTSPHSERTGIQDLIGPWNSPWDMSWEDNIYLVDSAPSFVNDAAGGSGDVGWAGWNADGYDTGSRAAVFIEGTDVEHYDPYPFNGGAM
jgi:hypothetical protein